MLALRSLEESLYIEANLIDDLSGEAILVVRSDEFNIASHRHEFALGIRVTISLSIFHLSRMSVLCRRLIQPTFSRKREARADDVPK